jgi:hypothetical protein
MRKEQRRNQIKNLLSRRDRSCAVKFFTQSMDGRRNGRFELRQSRIALALLGDCNEVAGTIDQGSKSLFQLFTWPGVARFPSGKARC